MSRRPVRLINARDEPIASLEVALAGGLYQGVIALQDAPPDLRRLFERFEELVEGQSFPLADQVEAEIERLPIRVAFEDGSNCRVADLQVFPSRNAVSFRTC